MTASVVVTTTMRPDESGHDKQNLLDARLWCRIILAVQGGRENGDRSIFGSTRWEIEKFELPKMDLSPFSDVAI